MLSCWTSASVWNTCQLMMYNAWHWMPVFWHLNLSHILMFRKQGWLKHVETTFCKICLKWSYLLLKLDIMPCLPWKHKFLSHKSRCGTARVTYSLLYLTKTLHFALKYTVQNWLQLNSVDFSLLLSECLMLKNSLFRPLPRVLSQKLKTKLYSKFVISRVSSVSKTI